MANFFVKYWENEEAREEGLSEIFSANIEILGVAIEQAKRLFFSQDFPCVEVEDEYGELEEKIIDLGKIQTKEIDFDKLNTENRYNFTTKSGIQLEYKLLTHGDEKKIDADVKALERLNKGGTSSELTTRYRYMITSVNGKTDTCCRRHILGIRNLLKVSFNGNRHGKEQVVSDIQYRCDIVAGDDTVAQENHNQADIFNGQRPTFSDSTNPPTNFGSEQQIDKVVDQIQQRNFSSAISKLLNQQKASKDHKYLSPRTA